MPLGSAIQLYHQSPARHNPKTLDFVLQPTYLAVGASFLQKGELIQYWTTLFKELGTRFGNVFRNYSIRHILLTSR